MLHFKDSLKDFSFHFILVRNDKHAIDLVLEEFPRLDFSRVFHGELFELTGQSMRRHFRAELVCEHKLKTIVRLVQPKTGKWEIVGSGKQHTLTANQI